MKKIILYFLLTGMVFTAEEKTKKVPKSKGASKGVFQSVENIIAKDENFTFPAIVGRTTDSSTVINVAPEKKMEILIRYGISSLKYTDSSKSMTLNPGSIYEFEIKNLKPDTRYYYQIQYKIAGEKSFQTLKEESFMTARKPGSSFVFGIQGDSHPERPQQFSPEIYQKVMERVIEDKPDFYLTMGDDFSVEKVPKTKEGVESAYRYQRNFLGQIGKNSPLFLVNGNHEHGAKYILDGTPDNIGVWVQNARNSLYSQPYPDGFFTGNLEKVSHIGYLRDYYSWNWGDALFVVIDPYWHSDVSVDGGINAREKGEKKNRDLWDITLGDAQYRWLEKTLKESDAKYKFVFTHHILGTGRGGTEAAPYYEWGGLNKKGKREFENKRPGWSRPIHELMKDYGVTIFFQGHDHIYVTQELDGVIYQSLPSPADSSNTLHNSSAYNSDIKNVGPGYVRVTVATNNVKVEYVGINGKIIHSYMIKD